MRWLVGFLCGAVVSFLGTLIAMWRKRRKEDKAVKQGIQCILRQQIIDQHEKWVDRQYCPIYAKEALKRAYDAYHTLGGNDVATDLYHETMELPTDKHVEKS